MICPSKSAKITRHASVESRHNQSPRRLLQPVVRFCEYFNTDDAETDANLLLGTTTRIEYEALSSAPEHVDYRGIRNEIRRLVSWIVNSN